MENEIQQANERFIHQAERAESARKIVAGYRTRCFIKGGPSRGNHSPMAFLVRIEAAKVTSFV
jgi:hypothetical protein